MEEIRQKLRKFAEERDWEGFHSPKNLAMALSVEAAELLEHFQWLTQEESRNLRSDTIESVQQEIGDVLIYLIRLADILGIDPIRAAREKIRINESKYPADRVRGSAAKYYEYKNRE